MREITIAGIRVADDTRACIVMDAGHNPGGDVKLACEMALSAYENGADIVKFQTRTTPKDVYQHRMYNRPVEGPQYFGKTYGQHREHIEFTDEEWHTIFEFCRCAGIPAISTPFSFKAVDLLESCGVPAYKVASGDANNIPFLKYIAKKHKPVILSTGGCTATEVHEAHDVFLNSGTPHAMLQCTCSYPPPSYALNLNAISWFRKEFPFFVTGLSCHSLLWHPAIAAYALGARIFEWHFTTDQTLKGTDNWFSLTPPMLKDMRDALDMTHAAMGEYVKAVHPCEVEPARERRKSLVWACDLPEGTEVRPEHIVLKCPGTGLGPEHLETAVGRVTRFEVKADEFVQVPEVAW